MFNSRLLIFTVSVLLGCTAFAADEETKKEKDMFRVGDRLRVHPLSAVSVLDAPVTIIAFGKKDWVLLEYDRSFVKAGESGAKSEKRQVWVNLDNIVAAEKLDAAAAKAE